MQRSSVPCLYGYRHVPSHWRRRVLAPVDQRGFASCAWTLLRHPCTYSFYCDADVSVFEMYIRQSHSFARIARDSGNRRHQSPASQHRRRAVANVDKAHVLDARFSVEGRDCSLHWSASAVRAVSVTVNCAMRFPACGVEFQALRQSASNLNELSVRCNQRRHPAGTSPTTIQRQLCRGSLSGSYPQETGAVWWSPEGLWNDANQ